MIERRDKLQAACLAGVPFAIRRQFRRGAFVVEAGCAAETLYLLRSGQARAFLLDEDGHETTTAILGPGQLVGVAPLLGHSQHRIFAQALTGLEVWALPWEAVRERLPSDAMLLGLVLGAMAQRFAVAVGLLKSVVLLPVAERVHDTQARLSLSLGGSPPALNRTALASLVQARPETLARIQATPQWSAGPLDPPVWDGAATRLATLRFRTAQVVLETDPSPGSVGVVAAGQVQVSLAGAGGRTLALETLATGDVFGLTSLLGLPPVGLRVVGLTDGTIEVLGTREWLQKLANQPQTILDGVSRLGARLEQVELRLARAGSRSASQRLLELLIELESEQGKAGPTEGDGVLGAWSHTALARQIGTCRETVTRGLAALVRAGAIRREGNHIVVLARGGAGTDAAAATRPCEQGRRGLEGANWSLSRRQAPLGSTAPEPPVAAQRTASRVTHWRQGAMGAHRMLEPHRSTDVRHGRSQARAHHPCRLCGLRMETAGPVCGGCAERLELELQLDARSSCPTCGRHQELCHLAPCGPQPERPVQRPERTSVIWLPIAQIDEPPAGQNSRRAYSEASIAQLAASLRTHGLLQPVCVRPTGSRYQVVFGVRRLRAALRAGLQELPCTVQLADSDRAFLLNTLENLHRQQLSGAERVRAIERLAATGLGVREISRRTGFNPSTISRWLRIDSCPEVKAALEAGTLDLAHARILVEAPRAVLRELVAQAPSLSVAELRARIASLGPIRQTRSVHADDIRRLRHAWSCLRAVHSPADRELLDQIRHELERLAAARPGAADRAAPLRRSA